MASQVLVEEKSCVRIFTLSRPQQLNALSFPMLSRLLELFLAFEEDPNVKLVILKGQGRAFCSGGDVAAGFPDIRRGGHWRPVADFMYKLYVTSYVIATNSKPQISILNGIVMGGGVGISVHGRFRIVTENTVFSMPETFLGHFPDVGASYFLSRLPGSFGEYIGLTGTKLDGAETLACGLATHFVPSSRLDALEADLCRASATDAASISEIINAYSQKPCLKESSAYHRLEVIDKCFSRQTVEEILYSLEREAAREADDWVSTAVLALKKASPTGLKIALRSIREGRMQGVGQCLIREFRMICHVVKGDISKDHFEGIRAILIDKDKNPKWNPSRLEDVTESMVEHYFQAVTEDGWTDLKLPPRPNLPASSTSKL
ncbi:PREDICTED: 3-hydroxyisobutyryl-CoA hydrolase 1-like [Tarenaya hassleriana]|uniref:3-hydroxyisobutyryl-CoA hydrolase 1-like n=1 Tax=Tarenaya hassleriana TaxID=28532 RepID=UPI00053C3F5C|nr:PREDICTED: 3-hydroxyisobutyryl-CoA hydrolase 1-like [Tarenaya hassleriana]